MRILHIVKTYYPRVGGIETAVRQIAEGTARHGHEVRILCFAERGAKDGEDELNGVKITRVKPLFNVGSASVSLKYLNEYRKFAREADIIHFHTPNPFGELAFCLFGSYGAKTLCTYHLDPVKPKIFVWMYTKLLGKFMKKVDVICPTSPHYIISSKVICDYLEKCRTVPLGVEVSSFQKVSDEKIAEVESLVSHLKRPRILFCGRFAYFKGIPCLLDALNMLPECTLIMVGDGPKREDTERRIDELKLRDRIYLAGLQSGEIYRAFFHVADIFAFPSTWPESFGIVGLEALAAGLPVITTEIWAGSSYFNDDGKTGIIIPPEDPVALAEAVRTITGNPELKRKMSENAKIRAEKFALEKMPERYEEIYMFLERRKNGN